jgi:hypothetical protein
MNKAEQSETQNHPNEVYFRNINALINEHFPTVLTLDSNTQALIVEQLTWVQQNDEFTSQASVEYNGTHHFSKHLHRETFRALTRIEQLLLLNDANNDWYQQFVFHQASNKLSKANYGQLQSYLKINSVELDALIRATLIASVPLSPEAKSQMKLNFSTLIYPNDSVLFSGFTIQHCPQMYPAYASASEDAKTLIRYCFPNDARHWRHMFYLENQAAFDALIKAKSDPKELRFWKLYWLVNAIGMDGHISVNSEGKVAFVGARFFDQSVHDRAMWLDRAIDKNIEKVAEVYSSITLSELEIETQPEEANLLCRILTMTNRISPKDAREVNDSLMSIDTDIRSNIIHSHSAAFSRKDISVTYLPALLDNLWKISRNNRHLLLCMNLYSQLALQHNTKDPLSLRLIDRKALEKLIEVNFDIKAVNLNEKSEVKLNENYSYEYQPHQAIEGRGVRSSLGSFVSE